MNKSFCLMILCCCHGFLANTVCAQEAAILHQGDCIGVLGGTFVERMQQYGYFETALQSLASGKDLTVRNLGWSGDNARGEARAVFGNPTEGYGRLQRDLAAAQPSVLLIAYGFAEALDGLDEAKRFADDLRRLLDDQKQAGNRVVLLQPYSMPGVKTADYDEALKVIRQAMADTAAARSLPMIDLQPLVSDSDFDNGLHLSEAGYRQLGDALARRLLMVPNAPSIDYDDARVKALRDKVTEKNQLFFHRYRPQNETYLFLFRKHEQGNNASDIPQFDPLIDAVDAEIHQAAR
ncbi:MAG: GDSL-type esterase/lipase family protein [Pirellulaceae bacterium]